MAGKVTPSEDGFTIRGIEPPGLRKQSDEVKLLFWSWALEIALKQKDRDLSMGLDKDGRPLRPISAATRKHRVSAMTPTGKGDPGAPPLEPGRQLSRTRSLLTGRAFTDRIELWWGFDPFSGKSWADVLYHQQEQGRDVFGLSPDALKRTMAQAWERYKKWLAGKPVAMPVVPGIPMARPIAMAGTPIGPFSTLGIGPAPTGQFSGGMTLDERLSYFRQPAAVNVPGRPGTAYNRILSHIWGPGSSVVVPKPPVAVPVRVAALKPAPPVKAKPVPAATGPRGDLLSAAVAIPADPLGDRLRAVVGAIDRLHGTAKLPRIPVRINEGTTKVRGSLVMTQTQHGGPLAPDRIEVDAKGRIPDLTFAHELGHFIEKFAIPGHTEGRRNWVYLPADDPMLAFKAAISASRAARGLVELSAKKTVRVDANEYRVDREHVRYLLRWDELWARAYAQWVATRSGKPTLKDQVDTSRARAANPLYHHRQWEDDDFEPIARVIDEMFRKIGWTK